LEELREALREVNAEIQHSSHRLVLELNWRKDGWCLLLLNVISKTAHFVLNLPGVIMNALIATLSVTRGDTEEDG
jgi:hypothetical protein